MEGQHLVSFFKKNWIWNTAIVFSHRLASFQFLLGFFQAPWISLILSWRMVKMDLQQLKPTPQLQPQQCRADPLPPLPLSLRHWGIKFAFFQQCNLTKCNLRSLLEPFLCRIPYFVIVYFIFPKCGIPHLFLLLFSFDKLSPIHHQYFYSNLAWNCLHSLYLDSLAIQTPVELVSPLKTDDAVLDGNRSDELSRFLTELFFN